MPILATSQITLLRIEEQDNGITVQSTPPVSPTLDQMWLDTSKTPHIMNRWDGSAWQEVGAPLDVDMSNYYTKDYINTQFSLTGSEIALKADKTTVDSFGNRLLDAETSLTVQGGQISSLATQITDTSGKLDSLAIGGRNYMLKTKQTTKMESPTPVNVWMQGVTMSPDFIRDCLGKEMVFSLYVRWENAVRDGSTQPWVGIQISYETTETPNGFTAFSSTGALITSGSSREWQRYSAVYKIPANVTKIKSCMASIQRVGGLVEIRHPMVELGNILTDYRPAPEDIESRMTVAESSITQHADKLALTVSKSEFSAEKIHKGTSPPSSPVSNQLWLDTGLAPNMMKRWNGSAWEAAGAERVRTSGIYIAPNDVTIRTTNFLLQLLDPYNPENVKMELDANGYCGFMELNAQQINSPSVVSAYTGSPTLFVDPTFSNQGYVYRSIGEALKEVNGKHLTYDVTIVFANAISTIVFEPEGIILEGITGSAKLAITGYSKNKTIMGYMEVRSCSCPVLIQSLILCEGRSTTNNEVLLDIVNSKNVQINECTFNGNHRTGIGIASHASDIHIDRSYFYNVQTGFYQEFGLSHLEICHGNCSVNAVFCMGGFCICSETVPAGTRYSYRNGQIFAAGVVTSAGTAPFPYTVESRKTIACSNTATHMRGWRSDTKDILQGAYSEDGYSESVPWNLGSMWFSSIKTELQGKTIRHVRLTITRKTDHGPLGPVWLTLCGISQAEPQAGQLTYFDPIILGYIERGQTKTFGVNPGYINALISGAQIKGLGFYETPYDFGTSTQSRHYSRFDGVDSMSPPELDILYL